jgi:hypothetical protein
MAIAADVGKQQKRRSLYLEAETPEIRIQIRVLNGL